VVVVVCRKCWIFGSPSGRLLKKVLTLKTTSSMSSGQTTVLRQPQKSSSLAFDLSISLFLQQLDFTHTFLSLCLRRLPLPLSQQSGQCWFHFQGSPSISCPTTIATPNSFNSFTTTSSLHLR